MSLLHTLEDASKGFVTISVAFYNLMVNDYVWKHYFFLEMEMPLDVFQFFFSFLLLVCLCGEGPGVLPKMEVILLCTMQLPRSFFLFQFFIQLSILGWWTLTLPE